MISARTDAKLWKAIKNVTFRFCLPIFSFLQTISYLKTRFGFSPPAPAIEKASRN
jgi:hypothetical protein